jgi:(p)ppGpp synthase/HD superfamily hydrolase
MPWLATQIVKDNMLKAKESRVIPFDTKLQAGDEIEVVLGYHIVNPKVAPKLGLESEKELTKFTTLKSSYFQVK